jgi:hypothetical protein
MTTTSSASPAAVGYQIMEWALHPSCGAGAAVDREVAEMVAKVHAHTAAVIASEEDENREVCPTCNAVKVYRTYIDPETGEKHKMTESQISAVNSFRKRQNPDAENMKPMFENPDAEEMQPPSFKDCDISDDGVGSSSKKSRPSPRMPIGFRPVVKTKKVEMASKKP